MEKLFLKVLKSSIISSLIIISSLSTKAQMECRSMIAAHLTPFKKDVPILWAVEGTMAPGTMTSPFTNEDNTKLQGGMLLGAMNFTIAKKCNIYIEGGYKNWKNSEFVNDTTSFSKHVGMRQLFYSFSNENLKIKLGLHEAKLGDYFLIDERIIGVSLDQQVNAFKLSVRTGTVAKNFARMGNFCANRHLYGLLHSDYTEKIGENPGETNLFGFAINWNPHYKKTEINNANTDEFTESSDEFNSTDEFHANHDFSEFGNNDEFNNEPCSEQKSKQKLSVKNIGLIVYDEFGTTEYIPDNKLYIGSLVDFNLPYNLFFQTGVVYQNMENNNSIVYIGKIGKNITWNNASNTKISGAYIGKADIDNNALFQPLFSNLFLGEIMRLDVADFPLWQVAIKHRFPGKSKFHIAIKAVGQLEDSKTNEQDIEFGIVTLKNHLKVTLIGSRVETQAPSFDNEFYMARVEMRLAF